MSRSQRRVEQLARIRDLRALSEFVAETQAARADRAARAQEAQCREEEDLLAAALDDWRAALGEARFDPVRAALFGQAVERQDRARESAAEELAVRSTARHAAGQEHSRARAGHRCAAELLRQAEHRERRLREERTLAARDDTYAARGAAS